MKIWCTILMFLGIAVLSACSNPLEQYAVRGGRGQGFHLCPYQCTVPDNVSCQAGVITGKIAKVSVERFAEDMEPGIALNIIDRDKKPVHVHVGPLWFMEGREDDFKVGDTVTIEGLCYHKNGKHYVVAAKMTHNGQTLNLRNSQGRPYWQNDSAS